MRPEKQQQFFQALKINDEKTLFFLLSNHLSEIDVNVEDEHGKTALIYAIENENFKVVSRLIKSDVNINQHVADEQKIKRHPLFYILRKPPSQNIKLIFEIFKNAKCKFDNEDFKQLNEYLLATAATQNLEAILYLIAKFELDYMCVNFNLINTLTPSDVITKEIADVINRLICISHTFEDLDQIFIKFVNFSYMQKTNQIGSYLLQQLFNRAITLRIFTATIAYKLDYIFKVAPSLLQDLLSQGLDANSKLEHETKTVIFTAISKKNIPAVKILLAHGADLNSADEEGNTPLHLTESFAEKELLELIFSQPNLNLFAKNKNNVTPIMILVENGQYELLKKFAGNHSLLSEAIHQYIEKYLSIHFLNESKRNHFKRYYDAPASVEKIRKNYARWRFRDAVKHVMRNETSFTDESKEIKKRYLERIEKLSDPDEAILTQLEQRFIEAFQKNKLNFFHASKREIKNNAIVNHYTRIEKKYGDPSPAVGLTIERGGEHLIFGYVLPVYPDGSYPRFPSIVLPFDRIVHVFDLEKLIATDDVVVKGNNGNYFADNKLHIRGETIADVHLHTEIRGFDNETSGKGTKYVIATNSQNQKWILKIKEREQIFSSYNSNYQELKKTLALDTLHRYIHPVKKLSLKAAHQLLFVFSDDFEQQFLKECKAENPQQELEKIRRHRAAEIFEQADIREATFATTELPFVNSKTNEKLLVKRYRTLTFQKEDLQAFKDFLNKHDVKDIKVDVNLGVKFFSAIHYNTESSFNEVLQWYLALPAQIEADDIQFDKRELLNMFFYEVDDSTDDREIVGTPLSYAIEKQRINMVLQLLKAGADPNAFKNTRPGNLGIMFGKTPLMIAVKNGDLGLVKILMEHGANPAICCDVDGTSNALTIAEELGYVEIFNYLLAKGARYPNGFVPKAKENSNSNDTTITLNKFIFECIDKIKDKKQEFIREKLIAEYLSDNLTEIAQAIMKAGYLKSYQSNFSYQSVSENYQNQEITREFHGAQHATRVLLEVLMMFGFAKQLNLPAAKGFSKTDLIFTCIAALFHDIARKGDGRDKWEKESRDACFRFLYALGLSEDRARYFANSIIHDESNQKSTSFVANLLQSADCIDVMRTRSCFYLDQVSLFQTFFKLLHGKSAELKALKDKAIDFVKDIRQLIFEQGDLYYSCEVVMSKRDKSEFEQKLLPKLDCHLDIDIKKQYEHADNCLNFMLSKIKSDPQFENLQNLLNTDEAKFVLKSTTALNQNFCLNKNNFS